ncbi:PAS domain-containing protein, partial [Pseudomonas sp. SIMBA_059]
MSGFSTDELVGQPHNVVRHPDMPKEAFADMWATLKNGEPWTALVKNRRKNGDHYWVRSNTVPVMRNGQPTGYMSVRTKASRDEIAAADALYRAFREGKQADYPLRSKLRELRSACFGRFDLIRMFLEIQIQAAFADGSLHPNERQVLYVIAEELGIS